jgi:transposase InsO family protein
VYAEVLGDERGPTCAAFIIRADAWFAGLGVAIERVITDNHFSYRRSLDFGQAVASIGAKQKFIQPRHPWTNGKVERFNRTMAQEWAYTRPYQSNQERTAAFAAWVRHYNYERKHGGIGWAAPVTRLGSCAPCTSGTRQQPAG